MQKGKVTSSLLWSFAERISSQMVSTVVSIVLARLLMPDDYGLIAIVMVFISLCDVLVTSGFGSALVQKKEVDSLDYNTAFILSGSLAVVLYVVLFALAPYIAQLYGLPLLSPVLRVLGIRIIVASYNSIQQAHIQRKMEFRRFFIATLCGTIVSCVCGLVWAYLGYGVWALVAQYMVNSVVNTIITSRMCGWKPRFEFAWCRARAIFSFGWKVLCSQLVATLESDIRSLIVGKVFGSADLAYFDQGKKFPALIVTNVNASLSKVMLPAFSRYQDERKQFKAMLRNAIKVGMYVMAPMMIGLFAVAETFVHVVLTEKWLAIVPFLQVFCLVYLMRPLETMCHQAVISLGRSDIALRIMLLINMVALGTVIVATFVFHSVLLMAILSLVNSFVSVVCFMYATNRLVGYRLIEQLQDIMPPIALAIVMGVGVVAISGLPVAKVLLLTLQVVTGACIYVVASAVCKLDAYGYLREKLVFVRKKASK